MGTVFGVDPFGHYPWEKLCEYPSLQKEPLCTELFKNTLDSQLKTLAASTYYEVLARIMNYIQKLSQDDVNKFLANISSRILEINLDDKIIESFLLQNEITDKFSMSV